MQIHFVHFGKFVTFLKFSNFGGVETESNTVLKKLYEAFYICKEKPIINDKSEVKILHRFLVQGDVILTR